VVSQCGPSGCTVPSEVGSRKVGELGIDGFEYSNVGSGIYVNEVGKLTDQQYDERSIQRKEANSVDIITNFNDYLKNFQDNANEMQRSELTQYKLNNEFGLEISGKENLYQGKWLDENTYLYHGTEITKDKIDEFEKTSFNPDGSVILEGDDGNTLQLMNNDPMGGSFFPQETNSPFNTEVAPSAGGGFRGDGGGGGESGGGGGDGGGAGGRADQSFSQAFQIAQQMVQFAQSMLGPLADSLKSNGKGKTSVSGPNEYSGVTAELENEAGIAFNKKGKDTLLTKNEEGKSVIKTKKDDEEAEVTNANILVPEQLAADINQETTITLQGIDGNDPSNPPLSASSPIPEVGSSGTVYTLFFPLLNSEFLPLISAQQVNFGQYIKLSEHNLDVSGRDIIVYALKTFNEIEAGGQNLAIHSGYIEIKIEGQKIMYPRLVKKAPYGFAIISNKLDQKNIFRLQHYEEKKGIFYDGQQITSVGDITTNHPRKDLIISKVRENMWKD